jgi:low temperature requirement protein LtrA
VATPLELFFDLAFVVAIAQAAAGLHHAIAEAHVLDGLIGYAMAFFAIWWAWMNFTWFGSAYDCDDAPYRLLVFVQIAGALILAAAIPAFFDGRDLTIGTFAYVVMRLALVAQWLRASAGDPAHRATARRYAIGVALVQIAWIGRLYLPPGLQMPGFGVLVLAELAVPMWSERMGMTPWHPHHIAERYGLMTIIVLGESILAATGSMQAAVETGYGRGELIPVIAGGIVIVCSLWWYYFYRPAHGLLTSIRRAFVWGYGHYFVFGAAAAVGAGLSVAADQISHEAEITRRAAGFAVAIPVAVFLVSLWLLHFRRALDPMPLSGPVLAALILLCPLTGFAIPLIAVLLAALLAAKVILRHRRADPPIEVGNGPTSSPRAVEP